MIKNKFSIVSVSMEVAPFAKTGGLADVARSLPLAFSKAGHHSVIIMPYFGFIDKKSFGIHLEEENIVVPVDNKMSLEYEYYTTRYRGVKVYFVDVADRFKKLESVYGSGTGSAKRVYLFCLAVIDLLGRVPYTFNILQLHDALAGLVGHIIKSRPQMRDRFKKTKIVYTIHNLRYQMEVRVGTEKRKDLGTVPLPSLSKKAKAFKEINFSRRAILSADLVTTVSRQYAQEIQNSKFGFGLEGILKKVYTKGKLIGIENGIDVDKYNPKTDPYVAKHYGRFTLKRKGINKLLLQARARLTHDKDIPFLGMASRISKVQKGFDLLFEILPELLNKKVQLVVVGTGNMNLMNQLEWWSKKCRNMHYFKVFDVEIASQIYASSDIYLMPSKFEPCGLGQLIALRYGSIPVVHGVGGLKDTIIDYDPTHETGNGFTFPDYEPAEFLLAIDRALVAYTHKKRWQRLVKRAMKEDHSWENRVKEYENVFYELLRACK